MRKFEGSEIMPQGMFSRPMADTLPNCFGKNGSYYSNGHITGNHLVCVLRDVGLTADFMFMVGLTIKLGELKESTCAHVGYGFNLPCYGLLRWMSRTSFMGDHVQVKN